MEKLLEHAFSKSSNTHSDKMIRISNHFWAMVVTIGVLKVESFSRHGTIPYIRNALGSVISSLCDMHVCSVHDKKFGFPSFEH